MGIKNHSIPTLKLLLQKSHECADYNFNMGRKRDILDESTTSD